MKDLSESRAKIDEIDNQIVKLYEERMVVATDVAEYKIATGKKVFDKEREVSKLENLSSKASNAFNKHGIRELFEQIMAMSRKKQYQLLTEHGVLEEIGFEETTLDFTDAKIVFQGVEGAYSQQAMMEFFGKNCDGFNVETWKDAMEAIKNGDADYAVLPIENSSAGIVSENYDLLAEYDNYIVGEYVLKIDHALLGLPGTKLDQINCVFSHPQALMQCSEYLDQNKNWEKISLKNTALSAKKVKEDNILEHAAIAGEINANLYGLEVLDTAIQNNKQNFTRFIAVTGKKVYDTKANKISICIEIPHESGSLYHTLSHFIYNNINMVNIQSRPIQGKTFEYRFFIDFEGKLTDHAVINALRGLEEETISLRILGTY